MYEATVTEYFSGAHQLRGYKGKCENLHGHNWKVSVTVSSSRLDKTGMVIDFGILKAGLRELLNRLDHAYLNEIPWFKKNNPTSENVAKFIYNSVKKKNRNLKSVSVWENENSCATYME